MKGIVNLFAIAALVLTGAVFGWCFDSGSNGEDGDFYPDQDIELGLSVDGDSVYHFGNVTIPSNVTVTFKRSDVRTPVYFLASGDVIIDGIINVSGVDGESWPQTSMGWGGPGGFDGGRIGDGPYGDGASGLGPGGGQYGPYVGNNLGRSGGGAGFLVNGTPADYGGDGGHAYSNGRIVPFTGGSGGGGGANNDQHSGGPGGGGGGAILIAANDSIEINGQLLSKGGKGGTADTNAGCGGGGSGGAIKLIANTIAGDGYLSVEGGDPGCNGGTGSYGRMRLEAYDFSMFNATTSSSPSVSTPSSVFVDDLPVLMINSVAGQLSPSDPKGEYGQVDITLLANTPSAVDVEVIARNVPVSPSTTVTVHAIPEHGASNSENGTLSGTDEVSSATVEIELATAYASVLMAEATFTVQTALYYDGEKVEKVRLASASGGRSQATYITESGREVPAEVLMASMHRMPGRN